MSVKGGYGDRAASLLGGLESADAGGGRAGGLARADGRLPVGDDCPEEMLGLLDFHSAVSERMLALDGGIAPVGNGDGRHAAGAGYPVVVVVVYRVLDGAALVAGAFEGTGAAVDGVVEAVGTHHSVGYGHFGGGAAGCFEDCDGCVGCLPAGLLIGVIGLRLDEVDVHQPAERVDGVGSAAEERCLGRLRVDAPVIGWTMADDVVHGVQVLALAVEDFAEVAGPDHLLNVAQAEGVADLVAHVVFEAMAVGQLDDAVTFGQCGCHGDFGEDVLAGFERHDGVPAVEVVGGGDDDEIDGGVFEHGFAGGEARFDAEFVRYAFGEAGVLVADGGNCRAFQMLEGAQVGTALSETEYADANLSVVGRARGSV